MKNLFKDFLKLMDDFFLNDEEQFDEQKYLELIKSFSNKKQEVLPSLNLKYEPFENLKVSTKTIICVSNMVFNLGLIFNYAHITPFLLIKKKRGKKEQEYVNPNINIPAGSIISIQCGDNSRGILFKKKKEKKHYFLNSVSIVMLLDNEKIINMKLCNNGTIQMTGSKNFDYCKRCLVYLIYMMFDLEEQTGEDIFTLKDGEHPKFILKSVMKNMNFNVGFPINRLNLHNFIKNSEEYKYSFCSIFESSSNNGVNIKIRVVEDTNELNCIEIKRNKDIISSKVSHNLFYQYIPEKELRKKKLKEKYHTFLVFCSGSIILSGYGDDMKNVYERFMEMILLNKDKILFEEC